MKRPNPKNHIPKDFINGKYEAELEKYIDHLIIQYGILTHKYNTIVKLHDEAKIDNELLIKTFKHTHKAKYINGKLVDECDRCGLDLRHKIHHP